MKKIENSTIDFQAKVNGNFLTARVRELGFSYEKQLEHHQIEFSDGAIKKFWFLRSTDNLIADDADLSYAEAVQNDIQLISKATEKEFYYIFQHTIDSEPVNVWVMPVQLVEKGIEGYGVYYKNKCRFVAYKESADSQWIFAIQDRKEKVEESLADRVYDLLYAVL